MTFNSLDLKDKFSFTKNVDLIQRRLEIGEKSNILFEVNNSMYEKRVLNINKINQEIGKIW